MRNKLGIGCACFAVLAAGLAGLIRMAGADDTPTPGLTKTGSGTLVFPATPRRVHVLFLGDNGHHVPLERCRDVASLMGQRGIDLVYTDDVSDLNPQMLSHYDVLMLYANITKIAPEQEKALLDFVESGHGFAPIHCASYCFLNSPKITALTGARFKSHNTGVFKETIAKPDHPIEKGLNAIESWDETYVHEMHNEQNREVLSYRVEGDHKEPYTWTRTEGMGRVFYTAWGHDERTWQNEDFQNLLERGLRWAAGDWALQPQPKREDFSYKQENIPFYAPPKAAGIAQKPITEMQQPISAQLSMTHMTVRPGFEVKLVASDPDIKKPICMTFDERGRLWVAETFDYPNNMQEPGQGHDQITLCEDTKGTGLCDKFTVFADKLSIPTSMVFANGGLIVSQAPDMLFLKDAKGTGHADERKVLFTGWGTRDTHAGPSNLRYGFDNWIYGTVGYSGFDGTVGGEHLKFGAGVYRFKPDGSKLEFLGSTTNNTWGLGISEDNLVFGSTANNNPSWYASVANRYYEQLSGWPASRFEPIADTPHLYPITSRVRQVDFHGSYTAAAGHALYTARSFPKSYWNRISFVTEPTGHIVGQFILEPRGSDFIARNDFNLLSSDDEWTAPIAAEVGPDGSLWMIDWYNFIVQHNPIPRGWTAGKGAAYESPLRDKRHGRVYRIIWKDGTPSKTFDLSGAKNETLLEAIQSPNMFWRMQAQRLLVEHGDKSVIPALEKLASNPAVDEVGLNPAAIHALWAIQGLGGFDGKDPEAIATAMVDLKHSSAGVRKAAVDVLPRTAESLAAILDAKMLGDRDPQVRKDTLLAISEMPASEQAGAAIFLALHDKQNVDDRWIMDAAAIAAATHDAGFLHAAFAAHPGDAKAAVARTDDVNVIPNPSFEEVDGQLPAIWQVRDYSGEATHEIASPGRTGGHCLKISSKSGADASMFVNVPVEPNTDYVLSGWIKTEKLTKASGGAQGALLNVHGTPYKTGAVYGTGVWQKVSVQFNLGSMQGAARGVVSINCLFGGWGHAKGAAFYDDVKLVKGQMEGLAGVEGRVIGVAAGQYAHRGPVDSVVAMLEAAQHANPALAEVVVNGLANGWPKGVSPKLDDAAGQQLRKIMDGLPASSRDGLIALAGRWGHPELFAGQATGVADALRKSVTDTSLDADKRVDAGKRLIMIDDSPAVADFVLKQITPNQPPAVQLGLLDALAQSRDPKLGDSLVGAYAGLTPGAQKETLQILIGKTQWVPALLSGIDSGKIDNRDVLQQQWTVLKSNPDEKISAQAAELQKKTGHAPSADRKEIVDKFLPIANKEGDPAKGKLVFEQNCMVCHTLEGRGAKVGPELTGVGARPRPDLIGKILDPNRSVEGTYRQWIVKTKSGDVIAGRIYAENKASIEIMDATAKLHEIGRDDIDRLVPTSKTLMPEGFEQLGEDKLVDLLSYLATSKVKH